MTLQRCFTITLLFFSPFSVADSFTVSWGKWEYAKNKYKISFTVKEIAGLYGNYHCDYSCALVMKATDGPIQIGLGVSYPNIMNSEEFMQRVRRDMLPWADSYTTSEYPKCIQIGISASGTIGSSINYNADTCQGSITPPPPPPEVVTCKFLSDIYQSWGYPFGSGPWAYR